MNDAEFNAAEFNGSILEELRALVTHLHTEVESRGLDHGTVELIESTIDRLRSTIERIESATVEGI